MKKRLKKVLKRMRELALKKDISTEETEELQELMQEQEKLEQQIEAQAAIERAEADAAVTAEADAEAKRIADEEAAVAAEAKAKADKEALEKELREKWDAEQEAKAARRSTPLTHVVDQPIAVRVSSPYDRLSPMDLAVRYEVLKCWGKPRSEKMLRALMSRVGELARKEDVLYIENGQAVKAPAIDWDVLIPRGFDLEEDTAKLYGAKGMGDQFRFGSARLGQDTVTKLGVNQFHQIAVKTDEVMHSDLGSYGDEWVPTLMAALLWRTIRLNAVVLPLMEQFDMPSQPYEYPKESTDPTFYYTPETEDEAQLILTGQAQKDSLVGTAKATFTARKLGAMSFWSEEMEEDSIISTEPQIRDQYGVSFAHNIDYVLINGDETVSATTNINFQGTSPSGSERYLVLDGLRHEPMITTSTDKRDGATLTIDDFGNTRALMGTAGKLGVNPADLVFLSDTGVFHKAMLLGEVLTVDKFGPMATVRSGQLASIFGVPYLVSEDYPLTDADGNIDDTAGDNVLGSFMCINRRGIKVGWKRHPRIRVVRLPLSEAAAIIASCRLDMQFFMAGLVGMSYNVTV